jgi:hypothetical protein
MLRFARVAMDPRRLVADHGLNGVRQNHFAFAAPGVDIASGLFTI